MEIQPLDPARDDLRAGLIAAEVANGRGVTIDHRAVTAEDMIRSPHKARMWAEAAEQRFEEARKAFREKMDSLWSSWGQ